MKFSVVLIVLFYPMTATLMVVNYVYKEYDKGWNEYNTSLWNTGNKKRYTKTTKSLEIDIIVV